MNRTRKWAIAGWIAAGLIPVMAITARQALSSDHADTPAIAAAPGTDLTDVFVFPSATNPNNVVLALCVHPLIPAGGSASFDPTVLYQFKIDNSGDSVEDLVIQATFGATGAGQSVRIAGPVRPARTGTTSEAMNGHGTTGTLNATFSPTSGMTVFAGLRADPFFFDLDQFFTILPDRAYPLSGVLVPDPNVPKATTWRAPGVAQDFLANFNVLAIVVEVPRAKLRGPGNGKIAVWCTTSK